MEQNFKFDFMDNRQMTEWKKQKNCDENKLYLAL